MRRLERSRPSIGEAHGSRDVQVTKSGLKYKILKPADCEQKKCAKPTPLDKVSVDFTGLM